MFLAPRTKTPKMKKQSTHVSSTTACLPKGVILRVSIRIDFRQDFMILQKKKNTISENSESNYRLHTLGMSLISENIKISGPPSAHFGSVFQNRSREILLRFEVPV